MKTVVIVLAVVVALIVLPILAFVAYLAITLTATDIAATQFANEALGDIATHMDARTFLEVAGAPYSVSLTGSVSDAQARGGSASSEIVMAGSTPDGVTRTFAAAKSQLGPLDKPGSATCRKSFGIVLCFGQYTFGRGPALLLAVLHQDGAGYEIRDLRIAPLTLR